MRFILSLLLVAFLCAPAAAEVVLKPANYQVGDETLQGFIAYDDEMEGPRPGVLVVHEWWGLNEFAKDRGRAAAGLGYVALIADMYGGGKSTDDPKVARRLSGHLRGTPQLTRRAKAGLQYLAGQDRVDDSRMAAIGYCFGGTTVLELAYSGADLAGVASFHGGLTEPRPEQYEQIKAKLLILHGYLDPHNPPDKVASFQEALSRAQADWQMIIYGGAVHSFTNPDAGSDPSTGVAYHPLAAKRSFAHMKLFLEQIFAK